MKNFAFAVALLTVSVASAQDYDMLNVASTATAQPAVMVSGAPAGPSGQAAPWPYAYANGSYGYYNGNYGTSNYNPYTDLNNQQVLYRYQNVKNALNSYAGAYGYFSSGRDYYKQQAMQGEDLYVRYLRYRDSYSYAALSNWLSQWEYQLGYGNTNYSSGWNTGYYPYNYNYGYNTGSNYTTTCYTTPNYGYNYGYSNYNYGYNCLPSYVPDCFGYGNQGYYNNSYYYPRNSWAYPVYANRSYVDGLQIGNGIGNIVRGNRYDNTFQTVGGVLSTAGGIIDIINSARGWR